MIKILTTTTDVPLDGSDLRENAFLIYRKLLKNFDSDQLMLLESLGINSVDSRVSMVSINPVITVNVKNKTISIHSNPILLKELNIADSIASLQTTTLSLSVYQLVDKKMVWQFLKEFEKNFSQVPTHQCGIMAFSCFSYETIHYIETIPETELNDQDDHDITLILYQSQLVIEQNKAELITYSFPGVEDFYVANIIDAITCITDVEQVQDKGIDFEVIQETTRHDYLDKVRKALHHVTVGDIYQVQIGQKIQVKAETTPLDVYRRLRILNPSPYMYLFSINGQTVIGASPELFLRISTDEEILMRPIAGTLGKREGRTLHHATQHLQADNKEVAEHMMLVDLCRNDIYRVCTPESLKVSGVLEIEEYSHVYHMVSTTKAMLKQGLDKYDVMIASFPAGTMTGAPKVRAMEIISELEDSQRGKYAGALGILGIGSNYINTALCIRSTVLKNQVYTLRASAGIVSDSQEQSEYLETLHKMGSMFKAITGEEISCHIESSS